MRALHILLVLFMMLVPFLSNDKCLLAMHVVLSAGILVYWLLSDDTCALTILECKLRGIENTESFIHSIVSPVYKFDDATSAYTLILIALATVAGCRAWKIHKKETLDK